MEVAKEEFNAFLEEQIDRVVAARPAQPYKELMHLLYAQLSPGVRALDSRIGAFARAFENCSQLAVPGPPRPSDDKAKQR